MEIIEYTPPTTWNDKEMNWELPNLACIDYIMALKEAIIERAILVNYRPDSALFSIMPYRPMTVKTLNVIREAIYRLAPYFVNLEFDDYEDDLSDFPKMWSYADLIEDESCRICEYPGHGALLQDFVAWFQAARNAINKLTAIEFHNIEGKILTRSGSEHDPPFQESINTAISEAMDGDPNEGTFSSFPQEFYAWSGNTDYKKDKKGKHGYCGYAYSKEIIIQKSSKPHPTAECDLIFHYMVAKPQDALSYSEELQYSVLDLGDSGLETGVFTKVVRWSNDMELDISIGNVNSIPKNSTVPSSDFSDNNRVRRSAKTGYEGIVYCILDFGVEKGFKFRKE